MSWEGYYWGPGGALEAAWNNFSASEKRPKDHISLASAYHSAAGRAVVECSRGRLQYLKRAIGGGAFALFQIEKAWSLPGARSELPQDLDAVDVSCAIWRRWGWIRGGRKRRVREVLQQSSWRTVVENPTVKAHTRAFLIVHAIAVGLGEKSDTWKWKLETLAREAIDAGEVNQGARVWKYIYQLYNDEVARGVAANYAGPDQRAKMGFPEDRGGGT